MCWQRVCQENLRDFLASVENIAFLLCELQKVVKYIFLGLKMYTRGFIWDRAAE